MQYIRGERYRLERGKGLDGFNWWVLTMEGEEICGGLPYADAKEHFDALEESYARYRKG